MRYKLLLTLLIMCSLAKAQHLKYTVLFDRNSSAVSKINVKDLTLFIKQIDSIAIDSIAIHGYSDYLGKKSHNLTLSQNRAQHVYEYLKDLNTTQLSQYITESTTISGKGEIYSPLTSPKGIPEHRKVEIICYRTPSKYVIDNVRKKRIFKPESGMKFNQVYVLKNVFFVGNEPELLEASIPELEAFLKQLKQIKSEFKLVIKGHICCLEDNATEDDKLFSRVLSTARALRIQDYLVKKGIPKEYIEYHGYSFDEPLIYPELNDNDRQTNRRVEAIVYK